jgi:phage-related protein
MTDKQINIILKLKDQLSGSLEKVSGKVDKMRTKINKAGSGINKLGDFSKRAGASLADLTKKMVALGAAAAATLATFGTFAIKAASDAEEVQNKFIVVFDKVSKSAESTAKTLAASYGLSQKQAKEMLAGTGDLLTGFGFTDKAALDLSKSVQELAVDLASFQNLEGGATRASDLLTKGLLGEREGLKSLGVVIRQVDLDQRIMEKGQQNLVGQAKLAAEAQATYELVLEQTTKAQGDFSRSSGSLANQSRVLNATFEDMTVTIGQKLLPIVTPLVAKVTEFLRGIDADAVFSKFEGFLIGAAEALQPLINSFQNFVTNIVPVVSDFIQGILPNLKNFLEGAVPFVASIVDLFGKLAEVILPALEPILSGIFDLVGSILGGISDVINAIIDAISKLQQLSEAEARREAAGQTAAEVGAIRESRGFGSSEELRSASRIAAGIEAGPSASGGVTINNVFNNSDDPIGTSNQIFRNSKLAL